MPSSRIKGLLLINWLKIFLYSLKFRIFKIVSNLLNSTFLILCLSLANKFLVDNFTKTSSAVNMVYFLFNNAFTVMFLIFILGVG